MLRSFTLAALSAALLSFLVAVTASGALAQPGKAGSPRKDLQRPSFPVPATPAPDGFEFGKIDWQGVIGEIRKQTLTRTGNMPAGAIAQEQGVTPTIPVLVPAEPALIRSMRMFMEPNSYSASGDIAGANVTIYGTHVFRSRAPDDPVARAASAAPVELLDNGVQVRVTAAESGIDLTFVRWGAAYLISIECGDPVVDTRCSDSAFIKSLALKMAIAG